MHTFKIISCNSIDGMNSQKQLNRIRNNILLWFLVARLRGLWLFLLLGNFFDCLTPQHVWKNFSKIVLRVACSRDSDLHT